MGHDTTHFLVQPVDENFICGICHDVLLKPTSACGDGHTFCAACLDSITQRPFRCPICRSEPLAAFALNRPLQNMIAKLTLCCPHHDGAGDKPPNSKRSKRAASSSREPKGCAWQGKLEDLEAHLRECSYEAVECPLGCGVRATRTELEAHQLVCPRRMVTCGCGKDLRADLLDKHKADECGDTMVKCLFCSKEMTRSALGTSSTPIHKFKWVHEVIHKLTGHYRECPKLRLRCPHYGCYELFRREDAPAHHTAFAHAHACKAHNAITELENDFNWERMGVTFQIPVQKLAGDRHITLKSGCCPVAGFDFYIKLTAAAQTAAVNVFVCAQEPDWTPVRVRCLSITAPLKNNHREFVDSDGRLEMAFNEDGRGGKSTDLEGSPDPSLGGPLKCRRKGARIENDDEESDSSSDYEYNDDTVTRKDLVDAVEAGFDRGGNVHIKAIFWVEKLRSCTLQCR